MAFVDKVVKKASRTIFLLQNFWRENLSSVILFLSYIHNSDSRLLRSFSELKPHTSTCSENSFSKSRTKMKRLSNYGNEFLLLSLSSSLFHILHLVLFCLYSILVCHTLTESLLWGTIKLILIFSHVVVAASFWWGPLCNNILGRH